MYSLYGTNFFWELHAKDVFCESGIHRNQNTGQENHLIFVAQGSCEIHSDSKETRVASRGLIYIRRHVEYTLVIYDSNPVIVYRLHFVRSYKKSHLDMQKLCELNPYVGGFMGFRKRICFLIDREDIFVTVNELINEMDANLEERDQMLSSLLTILYIKMSRSFRTHGIISGINYINEAKKYIADHYNEGLQVTQIAEHLGISRSYLGTIFSRYANRSITTHINAVRNDKAAYFLATTDKSILDIALSVGYNSRQNFTRVFRKHFGISPLQYRKLYGKQSRKHTI